jgi:hypothetical protein
VLSVAGEVKIGVGNTTISGFPLEMPARRSRQIALSGVFHDNYIHTTKRKVLPWEFFFVWRLQKYKTVSIFNKFQSAKGKGDKTRAKYSSRMK